MDTPEKPLPLPAVPLFGTWVSCADQLPDSNAGEWVLVVTKWNEQSVAKQDWEQGHKPDFWHVGGDYRYEMDDVTHWMPLPPLPNVNVELQPNGGSESKKGVFGG